MQTMADKIIDFNTHLSYHGKLPAGIRIMNPFAENPPSSRSWSSSTGSSMATIISAV